MALIASGALFTAAMAAPAFAVPVGPPVVPRHLVVSEPAVAGVNTTLRPDVNITESANCMIEKELCSRDVVVPRNAPLCDEPWKVVFLGCWREVLGLKPSPTDKVVERSEGGAHNRCKKKITWMFSKSCWGWRNNQGDCRRVNETESENDSRCG